MKMKRKNGNNAVTETLNNNAVNNAVTETFRSPKTKSLRGTFAFLPLRRAFTFLSLRGTFAFLSLRGTFAFLSLRRAFTFLSLRGAFTFLSLRGVAEAISVLCSEQALQSCHSESEPKNLSLILKLFYTFCFLLLIYSFSPAPPFGGSDKIIITATDQAPSVVTLYQDTAFLKLSLDVTSDPEVDDGKMTLDTIRLQITGTSAPSDIYQIKLYRNSYGGVLKATTNVGGNGWATLSNINQQVTDTSPVNMFIGLEISSSAVVGRTVGVRIGSENEFDVSGGSMNASTTFPMYSSNALIDEANVLTLSGENMAQQESARGGKFDFLRLTLVVDSGDALLRSIRISLIGSAQDTDVGNIELYKEGEGSVSQATFGSDRFATFSSLNEIIITSNSVYLIKMSLISNAGLGSTVGVDILSNSDISLDYPATVSTDNFPIYSIESTIISAVANTLTVFWEDMAPTQITQAIPQNFLRLTLAVDSDTALLNLFKVSLIGSCQYTDVGNIELYKEGGTSTYKANFGSDRLATFTNLTDETITTSNSVYLISVSLTNNSEVGTTVGLDISDNSFISLMYPDVVDSANFPISSIKPTIEDKPDTLTLTLESFSLTLGQGSSDIVPMRLTLNTNEDNVVLKHIKLTLIGGSSSDISEIRLVKEGGDTLATATFSNQYTSLGLVGETITASDTVLNIAVDIIVSAGLNTLTLSIPDETYIGIDTPDTVQNFSGYNGSIAITDKPDVLGVTVEDVIQGEIMQGGARDFLRLTLKSDSDTIVLNTIKISLTGSISETEVIKISLYKEGGGSLGEDVFDAGRKVTFTSLDETITMNNSVYLVFVSITEDVSVGKTIGLKMINSSYIEVAGSDTVNTSNFPVSVSATVTDKPDKVNIVWSDISPPGIFEGESTGILKLSMYTDTEDAGLSSIRLLLSGTGNPSDISAVKLYKDTNPPDGIWQTTDWNLSNTTFESDRFATLDNIGQIIDTTGGVYFIVWEISNPAGIDATVGVTLPGNSFFFFTGVDTANSADFPIGTGLIQISDVGSTVISSGGDNTPATGIAQGETKSFLKLTLKVSEGNAILQSLNVSLIGNGSVSDISSAKLYRDSNTDGTWQITDESLSGGVFNSDRWCTLSNINETIDNSDKIYFVVMDISLFADNKRVGVSLPFKEAVSVNSPNVVSPANFPISSLDVPIFDLTDTLTVAGENAAPVLLTQADEKEILRLTLTVNNDSVIIDSLRLSLVGTCSYTDISSVKLYKEGGNSTFETNFSADRNATFSSLIDTVSYAGSTVYLVSISLKNNATIGSTIGIDILANSFVDLVNTATSSDVINGTNFPIASSEATISERPDTLIIEPVDISENYYKKGDTTALIKFTLTASDDEIELNTLVLSLIGGISEDNIENIQIYKDEGNGSFGVGDSLLASGTFDASRLATLNFSEVLNTASELYFVVISIGDNANYGDTVGIELKDIIVTGSDLVSDSNIPFSTEINTIYNAYTLLFLSSEDLTPTDVNIKDKVGMLKISMKSDYGSVKLQSIVIKNTVAPFVDEDIALVSIYKDDGDGTLSSVNDEVIRSGVFSDGVITLDISSEYIETDGEVLFIEYEISDSAVSDDRINAVVELISVSESGQFNSNYFPIVSATATVKQRDTTIPEKPTGVVAKASGNKLTVMWNKVDKNTDGSNINDMSGYIIERAESSEGTFALIGFISATSNKTSWDTEISSNKVYYYRIKAQDIYENESEPSDVVGTTGYTYKKIDDNLELQLPSDLTSELNSKSISVSLVEKNANVSANELKVYEIKVIKQSDKKEIDGYRFNEPIKFVFNITKALATRNKPVVAQFIGLPYKSSNYNASLPSSYDVFWYDNVKWIRMSAEVNTAENSLTASIIRTGLYKVAYTERASEFKVITLTPKKVFTPNGDGVNDEINIVFENPKNSVVEEAKIYDIRGREIADLSAGALENSYRWDGKDRSGNDSPIGVYIYQIRVEGKVFNGTIVLAR